MSEREAAFARAFAYLHHNAIAGDVVELGVHRGESLATLTKLAQGREVYGVDSFQGLPEPSERDSGQFKGGQFKAGVDQVRAYLTAQGAGRASLVEGFFADCPKFAEPVALVHLDCDLYQSALDGLALVDPVDGAVVLIDDWYCHRARPDMGVRRGWTEWLRETGRSASWFDRYGWHGSAWVVHREGTA